MVHSLEQEHPTLARLAGELVRLLSTWEAQLRPSPSGSVWLHHGEYAERTERLAAHLAAVVQLAASGHYPSALAVARTALEHHALDRLLLLADRYIEIVKPDDPADIVRWETEWASRAESWTQSVDSVERVRGGQALKLVRRGHSVRDEKGVEVERVSPYAVAMERHDAFLGRPDMQPHVLRAFDDLEERVIWAKNNQTVYGAFLRWGSVCQNLKLNGLLTPAESLQLQMHYSYLSGFAHATNSGYALDRTAIQRTPSAAHLLSELALLYVGVIAIAQIEIWDLYVQRRSQLLSPLSPELRDQAKRARAVVAYFWLLIGEPQPIDFFDEANRLALPMLLAGSRPAVAPRDVQPKDVGYYANPFERLRRMHLGEQEMMTGFGFPPMWATLHW